MLLRLKLLLPAILLTALSASAADIAVLRNGFEVRHARREQLGGVSRLYLDDSASAGYVDVPTEEIATLEHDDGPVQLQAALAVQKPAETAAAPAAAPVNINRLVSAASDRHQVDADLIASVIRAESGFRPHALSPKGAQGLMQLMPQTASRLGVADPFQPEANIDGGTRYLRDLLIRYHDDIPKALAAYNAGPERVERYGGLPPFRETHAYVARVIRDFNQKKIQAEKTKKTVRHAPPPPHKTSISRKRSPAPRPQG